MRKLILLLLSIIVFSFLSKAQFTAGNLAVFRAEAATANNTNFSIVELNRSTAYQLSTVTTIAILLRMLIRLLFNPSLSQKLY